MRKKLFFILALLCAVVQGAWAQASWDEVYAITNTTSANWTALPEGTTAGATIGMAGTTTYYYASKHIYYGNSTPGGSALTILGTVYIYMPYSFSVTCTGANASGQTGAGAGIELTEGNSLFLLGEGEVSATGGNAANGGDGTNGSDAGWDNSNYWSGTGGAGGNGGGGAGAGIGTRGGQGGNGGAGAASIVSAYSTAGGGSGSAGQAGATAGAMGGLYVAQSFGNLTATGGAAASQSGSAGGAGKGALYDGASNYSAAGGGGGGGGGFGGAATGIGTGGPGGGGGASSNLDWASSGYYVVKAPSGKGGQNADGTWAAAGAEGIMNHNGLKNGQVVTNGSGWEDDQYNYDNYTSSQAVGTGGSGGALGNVSTSESAITMTVKLPSQSEWDMVYLQTQTNKSQWTALPLGARKGATIGTAGTTTYYYATGDRTFINSNAGGSGLTILGTVYIFIPSGNQITCTGAHADGATGAGAGIELTAGNTLYLIGSGKLVATGGNAANGGNGENGENASFSTDYGGWVRSGNGGRGGNGGGGAGAGIGTSGGNGGDGGAGGAGIEEHLARDQAGNAGSNGANGGTAAEMGTLYIYQMPAPTMEILGGSGGNNGGNGGTGGLHVLYRDDFDEDRERYWSCGGGGGGAGGGKGGAASNIGTGGPGGGGGGGGASGTIQYSLWGFSFYQVGAFGGNPGTNADGTLAGTGESTLLTEDNGIYLAGRHSLGDKIWINRGWSGGDNRAAGGNGGAAGTASIVSTYSVAPATIILADNADNSTTINDANGYFADVTLSGRTLYKDGAWNTLCLPFNVTLSGSPLNGATARPLTAASISGTTLHLTFGDEVTTLVAGTPYIIKWIADANYVNDDAHNIVSPVFSGVTIDKTDRSYDNGISGDNRVRFLGTYKSTTFTAADNSILLLGGENKLYYPAAGAGIGAQRAYFKIGSDGAQLARSLTSFSIDFGEGDNATGIISVHGSGSMVSGADAWYTLDGRRLSGKPSVKGVYVNNGRKVIIK